MNPNDATARQPADKVEDDDDVLELGEEWNRFFADKRWSHRQLWLGTFAAYAGEWVGVFNQQVVGHHRSLIQLRADVEREHGITPAQLAVTFVADANGTGVGRIWLA